MIADTIKELRLARNWTQAELARKLGITRNGVNAWEQGLSTPSLASIIELSKVFSVSSDYLLGLSDLETISVSGLSSHDVALITELVGSLKNRQLQFK